MSTVRIAHLTVVRKLASGQRKQLRFEHTAAKALKGTNWTTIALDTEEPLECFQRKIPRLLRPMFFRNFYGWLEALRLSKTHDVVLMRHMTFDPFAFIFAPMIKNRISVHHAKELEELRLIAPGWKGRIASALEKFSGRIAVHYAIGILGVTQEIADYERELHAPNKLTGIYPNGIDSNEIALLGDKRSKNAVNAAFMCGVFSPWHGLDKLIAAVDSCDFDTLQVVPTIHLIGRISDDQKNAITATPMRAKVFRAHGMLDESKYRPLIEQCDIGVGSLAMERQNLREGSTLKVREMLAMGLPIYSGHHDGSFPKDYAYYIYQDNINLLDFVTFALKMKSVSRRKIRQNAIQYISKLGAMEEVVTLARIIKGG